MVSAAVGFQCPDCVRDGQAGVRQARTLTGGAIHGDPVLVTKVLIAINVGVYALNLLLGDALFEHFAMQGAAVALKGQQYILITSAFLHAGFTHLAFNMLALWFVGGAVEPRLGRWRYLTVYLLSALGGSVLSYVVDSPLQTSVGASGAVFGLFGALFVLMRKLRFDVGGIVGLIVVNAVIGFIPGLNINWRAHLGGLIIGTLLTLVMVYAPQRSRFGWSVAASLAILVILTAATMQRSAQIHDCSREVNGEWRYDPVCFDNITRIGAPASVPDGRIAPDQRVSAAGEL
jgi:membrane associated rhomboid family serine protease